MVLGEDRKLVDRESAWESWPLPDLLELEPYSSSLLRRSASLSPDTSCTRTSAQLLLLYPEVSHDSQPKRDRATRRGLPFPMTLSWVKLRLSQSPPIQPTTAPALDQTGRGGPVSPFGFPPPHLLPPTHLGESLDSSCGLGRMNSRELVTSRDA
ncbi:uncharacterized protein ACOB8E_006651 [Sarcophilus harrisii]